VSMSSVPGCMRGCHAGGCELVFGISDRNSNINCWFGNIVKKKSNMSLLQHYYPV
jgi:hypothetical protein